MVGEVVADRMVVDLLGEVDERQHEQRHRDGDGRVAERQQTVEPARGRHHANTAPGLRMPCGSSAVLMRR